MFEHLVSVFNTRTHARKSLPLFLYVHLVSSTEFDLFFETGFLCSFCCPETHSVDQAGLELTDLPASASRILRVKVCTTTTWPGFDFECVVYNELI